MALFDKKEQGYLGVDIGAHGIKLVELKKSKGRPQLWTYGIASESLDIHPPSVPEKTAEELREEKSQNGKKKKGVVEDPFMNASMNDPRVETYAQMLKDTLKQAKVTSKSAAASLPVSYIFHAVLTLPKVEKKVLDSIVRAEVQKLLSRPVEEMQIVHQVIGSPSSTDKYMRLLVTAAPRNLVSFYSAIFQKAGLQLNELETEAFALQRSLVGRDKATSMIIDIGAERTNFFIIDQGLPMTHRTIQLGGNDITALLEQTLGVNAIMAEQIKQDVANMPTDQIRTEMFAMLFDPIVKEIQYGFDLFLSQSGNVDKRPEKIILTGGSALFPFIRQTLEQAFDMKVFIGDPWARVVYQQGLKPLLDVLGPRMSVSIGLALRGIEKP